MSPAEAAEAPGLRETKPSARRLDGEDPGVARHSFLLVAVGLSLSLAAFLSMAVLGIVALAAFTGVPVPLLAAKPTCSASLLVLQLLASMGQCEGVPAPLRDLSRSLVWAQAASPGAELASSSALLAGVWLARRAALRQHGASSSSSSSASSSAAPRPGPSAGAGAGAGRSSGAAQVPPPHGLSFGAWELRAAGLLAFPLAAAATRALSAGALGEAGALGSGAGASLSLCGSLAAVAVLLALARYVLLASNFVAEVLGDGHVVRVSLPSTAGGAKVFVDRVCDQLLALPVSPAQPSCATLFGDWLTSPAWCVAPAVAAIHEVQHRGPLPPQDEDIAGGSSMLQWASPWCSMDDGALAAHGELEDELQGRPLLVHNGLEREDTLVSGAVPDKEAAPCGESPDSSPGGCGLAAAKRPGEGPEVRAGPRAWASAVSLAHPVRVATRAAYHVRSRDILAGVACIPWLDCAVPAGVLPRIEELGGEVVLQVHPGQLCGGLSGGRFAVCFDWGTRWPWRWPAEVALKAALGAWASAPLARAPVALAALAHLLMLSLATAFAYHMLRLQPYMHANDNAALGAMSLTAVLVVMLRGFGSLVPGLAWAISAVTGAFALVPYALLLLCAMGLVSATLDRLEAQGLHDKLLPRTIHGWGSPGQATQASSSRMESTVAGGSRDGASEGACGGMATGLERPALHGHAVEVILPGQRNAFAIVLPAVTRPRVVHTQLLPPVGRGGESPGSLPPCAAGDRARLPVPPAVLFPPAGRVGAPRLALVPPLAALLAPGRPGRLIYREDAGNEGREWRQAVRDFFGEAGSLAEEAERLVEKYGGAAALGEAATGAGEGGDALVVVEVLPAFAAEFMDERAGAHGSP